MSGSKGATGVVVVGSGCGVSSSSALGGLDTFSDSDGSVACNREGTLEGQEDLAVGVKASA